MIPASKLPAIHQAVMAACDAIDGVTDGVLEDPRTCRFDPAVLACKGTDGDDCLTAPQVQGLKKVYDGPKNPRNGESVFPGYMRGGEAGWGSWIVGTDVPPRNAQHGIQVPFFRFFVFDNPDWDWKSFDFDKGVALADKKVGGEVNAIDPDLRKFRERGGKLVQYHGWSDPAISPLNSVNYFASVKAKMGETQDFYRFFLMPGVGHCSGGPGPSTFDKMGVIVNWVENGKAPEQIVAEHSTGGKTDRTRPLCAYPKIAKYKGSGSTNDAANFACVAP
jgi:feruloyl esterase